ncbi:P-type conjugative transfer protein TrbL [Undibacterium arcticum]|uniref:P-type conjugative transfer protein TrbL n=1 Tax=Undibacterium arcticum TaxID=1762892 RepID=A0ABV7FB37_9BURK
MKKSIFMQSILYAGVGSFRKHYRAFLPLFILVVLGSASIESLAQASTTFNVLNPVRDSYAQFQNTWYTSIRATAERLFWILVSVDFAWSGVIYVLEKNDIAEIVISNVKKILTIGFFYSLLKFSNTWIPAIIDSFTKIGQTAGNVSASTASPDGLAGTGFELAMAAFKAIHDLGMLDSLAVIFPVTMVAIIILLSFLFVAAQLLVTQIESFLAIGAGVILLGFGGSRWTTDFATKYLQYAVGTGIKLMLLYLVVGVGQTITQQLYIDPNQLIDSCLKCMGVALVFGYLAIQIPAMASAMMSGSPSMTAGALAGAALTMGAAAAGAGGAAVAGGKAAQGGAGGAMAGAAGLSKALGAGMSSAMDVGKTGMAGAMHAAGQVANEAVGMAKGGIGDAIAGGSKSFGEKVAGSTGGKIAANIEAGRGGQMGNAPGPANGSGPASPPNSGPGPGAPASSATASEAGGGGIPGSEPVVSSALGGTAGPSGDASSASIDNGAAKSNDRAPNPIQSDRDPMHRKIRELDGFIPSDAAGAAGINIDLKHTAD